MCVLRQERAGRSLRYIRPEGGDAPPFSKMDVLNLLPKDRIPSLPLFFGFHGTSADAAMRLFDESRARAMPSHWPNKRGFYVYFCCREFPKEHGGAEGTPVAEVNRAVFSAIAHACFYASSRSGTRSSIGLERGLGLVALEFHREEFGMLQIDRMYSPKPHPHLGPIPVFVPEAQFETYRLRILGAAVSGPELNKNLTRLTAPDGPSELSNIVLSILRKKRSQVADPDWMKTEDVSDEEIKESVRRHSSVLPGVDRHLRAFFVHAVQILTGASRSADSN